MPILIFECNLRLNNLLLGQESHVKGEPNFSPLILYWLVWIKITLIALMQSCKKFLKWNIFLNRYMFLKNHLTNLFELHRVLHKIKLCKNIKCFLQKGKNGISPQGWRYPTHHSWQLPWPALCPPSSGLLSGSLLFSLFPYFLLFNPLISSSELSLSKT